MSLRTVFFGITIQGNVCLVKESMFKDGLQPAELGIAAGCRGRDFEKIKGSTLYLLREHSKEKSDYRNSKKEV
jgi:hypothetical protein